MDSLRELTEHGKSLNLSDAELQQFINQQQAHQRELRAAEREKEREEREFTLKKEAEDRGFILKKEELEIEKLRLQEKKGMEDLEGKYKFIIDKLEQKLAVKETSSESFSNAKVPKMPFFDEVKDDIDSYLRRFERYSTAQKWKPESWAVNLSALLRGRALNVYALLPQEKALHLWSAKNGFIEAVRKD